LPQTQSIFPDQGCIEADRSFTRLHLTWGLIRKGWDPDSHPPDDKFPVYVAWKQTHTLDVSFLLLLLLYTWYYTSYANRENKKQQLIF
jgi:hypothetical protein